MNDRLRIGIIGCGTIGSYILDAVMAGHIENSEIVMVCGRSDQSKGAAKVKGYGLKWIVDYRELLKSDINLVVEAASHEALEEMGVRILRAGIDLIPVSIGSLVSVKLLEDLKLAAREGKSIMHIPSGGIGGLDAIQAAIHAGVEEISMTSRKPPVAWKGIPYVEQMKLDLDQMNEPTMLYEGPARDCVKKFPQNINIAAALSLAGIGFDSTRIRIVADPTVVHNTHEIHCRGEAGRFSIILENVPVPENPKTTYMACLSTLATIKNLRSCYRVGT